MGGNKVEDFTNGRSFLVAGEGVRRAASSKSQLVFEIAAPGMVCHPLPP